MFLHHIHTLPSEDPVNKIFQQQKLLPDEKNWYNNISSLLVRYNLSDSGLEEMSKDEWKMSVDTSVNEVAFTSLTVECGNMTKTHQLQYDTFERQSYITTCPSDIARLLFRIRGKIINCRDNHHQANPNLTCRLCHTHIETQNHAINCREVRSTEEIISLQPYISPSFEIDS